MKIKELEINKKLRLWQIIVLIQLVLVIFLGLLGFQQNSTLAVQRAHINVLEEAVQIREQNSLVLSRRLVAAMTLLQSAAQQITGNGSVVE